MTNSVVGAVIELLCALNDQHESVIIDQEPAPLLQIETARAKWRIPDPEPPRPYYLGNYQ